MPVASQPTAGTLAGQLVGTTLACVSLVAAVAMLVAPLTWPWITAALAVSCGFALVRARHLSEDALSAARAQEQTTLQRDRERRALQRDRDRLQSILGAMSEGVVLLDTERRIVLANPSARVLLQLGSMGAQSHHTLGDSLTSTGPTLLDVNRLPLLHALVDRGLSGERAAEELTLQSGRQVLVRTAPLATAGGDGAVLVFNDVTDLRRLEAVRRDLVANVSHELRTPLTAIRGYAETLLNGALQDAERAAEFIAIIHRHAERLSLLLDDLLELSRLEAGSRPLKAEAIALRPLILHSLDLVRPKATTRQVELTTEVPDGPDLLGDPEALEQVLVNLLDNAVKYTPANGRITLQANPGSSEGSFRIAVSDNGLGIEREHLPRVFERFYRVDPGRSRDMGGTGLGLAIVKHLAQAMGGSVGVDSEPGKGSTFWVELPVA